MLKKAAKKDDKDDEDDGEDYKDVYESLVKLVQKETAKQSFWAWGTRSSSSPPACRSLLSLSRSRLMRSGSAAPDTLQEKKQKRKRPSSVERKVASSVKPGRPVKVRGS